jgi:hypothetical protein
MRTPMKSIQFSYSRAVANPSGTATHDPEKAKKLAPAKAGVADFSDKIMRKSSA